MVPRSTRSLTHALATTSTTPTTTTIFAPCTVPHLSTAYNSEYIPAAAVCIIRLSGPDALHVLHTLTRSPTTPSRTFTPNQLYVRSLYHPISNAMLDTNALVAYFEPPRSFTGEDVVELHVHGSHAVVQGVVAALMSFGSHVQPALPGEFTKRAFYNDKMDLLQVESLGDVLTAETQAQKEAALGMMTRGDALVTSWRKAMISITARIEAVIDFGEDDLGDVVEGEVREAAIHAQRLSEEISGQLRAVPNAEIVQHGLRVVFIGPPNVGKSSLLNLLVRKDAPAIVSPLPGTTRDVLERAVDIGGHKVVLIDGAGLRELDGASGASGMETDGPNTGWGTLEEAGMGRIVARATEAHVVVVMDAVDVDEENPRVRREVQRLMDAGKTVIRIRNKVDLLDERGMGKICRADGLDDKGRLYLSCRTGAGVDRFLERLRELVVANTGIHTVSDGSKTRQENETNESQEGDEDRTVPVMYKERHVRHLRCTLEALERFQRIVESQDQRGLELAAEELRIALTELGHVVGTIDIEDLLDDMTRKFCIGK